MLKINKLYIFTIMFFLSSNFSLGSNTNEFIQNPWYGYQVGKETSESTNFISTDIWEQFFGNGEFLIAGIGTYNYSQPAQNNYAYGTNIFAQSGKINSFSIGVNYINSNPWLSETLNPKSEDIFLPTNSINGFSQAFLQYDNNTFQISAGRLYIETPWLSSGDTVAVVQTNYQGIFSNYYMTDNLVLTAVLSNRYKGLPQNNFTKQTMYSLSLDPDTGVPLIINGNSKGSIVLGGVYTPNDNFNMEIWGYSFLNYVNMIYFKVQKSINVLDLSNIGINFQTSLQTGSYTGKNVFVKEKLHNPSSQMIGLELTYSYNNIDFNLGYNGLFGKSDSYLNEGIVSPYTYEIANDPLFTTSYIAGMVEKSGGNAIKVSVAFNFLENSLKITPSYAYYNTNAVTNSAEYDVMTEYEITGVNGLSMIVAYSLLQTFGQENPYSNGLQVVFTYLY